MTRSASMSCPHLLHAFSQLPWDQMASALFFGVQAPCLSGVMQLQPGAAVRKHSWTWQWPLPLSWQQQVPVLEHLPATLEELAQLPQRYALDACDSYKKFMAFVRRHKPPLLTKASTLSHARKPDIPC